MQIYYTRNYVTAGSLEIYNCAYASIGSNLHIVVRSYPCNDMCDGHHYYGVILVLNLILPQAA